MPFVNVKISKSTTNSDDMSTMLQEIKKIKDDVRIGIIGDFNSEYPSHIATNKAIEHAGSSLKISTEIIWLPTTEIEKQEIQLERFDALWCSPGSPYQSMEGAILAIQFAREKAYPFIGTWGGFQHTLVEYARNVLGIKNAGHEENNPKTSIPLINQLKRSLVGKSEKIELMKDTLAYRACRRRIIEEKYSCSYSLNPEYQERFKGSGLKIVGSNEEGAARVIELTGQAFFLASLFLPQMNSTKEKPHPMVLNFLKKALRFRQLKEDPAPA